MTDKLDSPDKIELPYGVVEVITEFGVVKRKKESNYKYYFWLFMLFIITTTIAIWCLNE